MLAIASQANLASQSKKDLVFRARLRRSRSLETDYEGDQAYIVTNYSSKYVHLQDYYLNIIMAKISVLPKMRSTLATYTLLVLHKLYVQSLDTLESDLEHRRPWRRSYLSSNKTWAKD